MRASSILAGTMGIAAVAVSAAAWGQATEEGAAEIRQGLQEWIDTRLGQEEGVEITFDGEIEVVPADDIYDITIPRATVTMGDGDVSVVIDPIEIEAVPLENGWYEATWVIPDTYVFENTRLNETATVTIGSQEGSGVFAPQYETFMVLDADLQDIVMTPPEDQGELSLGLIGIAADSEEVDAGVYDSVFEITLEDLNFRDENTGETFSLGRMALDGSGSALNMDEYVSFARSLDEIMQDLEGDDAASSAMFTRFSELIEQTSTLFDGMAFNLTFQDVNVVEAEQTVTVEEGGYSVYIDGLTEDSSTLGLAFDLTGVQVDPAPEEARFMPQETVVRLALVDLPNDQLLEILQSFLQLSAETNPDDAMMMAGMQLQQAIMAGGTTLQIEEVSMLSDLASLRLDGVVEPDPNAAFGVTADASMAIAGLGDLIRELQTLPDASDVIPFLTLIQSMGAQAAADDAGREVRTYDLVVTADGTFTLNGTDMGPMLQQMQ